MYLRYPASLCSSFQSLLSYFIWNKRGFSRSGIFVGDLLFLLHLVLDFFLFLRRLFSSSDADSVSEEELSEDELDEEISLSFHFLEFLIFFFGSMGSVSSKVPLQIFFDLLALLFTFDAVD